MAEKVCEDVILRDLRSHLQTANIPLDNVSTLARQGDDRLVQQFLTENIRIDRSGAEARQSQLYIACFWGIRDTVRTLLDAGIDPNKQNHGSLWTPLHAATFQEHGPVALLLLDHGAQPELPDSEGRTSKDFASASDKIWPLFAAIGLDRTPRVELIEKQIIRQGSARAGPREPGYGIKMAEYSGPRGSSDEQYLQAAMMGDVLADEDQVAKAASRSAANQPHFALWK